MRRIVLKFTFFFSAIILFSFLMTGHLLREKMTEHFYDYLKTSIKTNPHGPYIKEGHIIIGLPERDFLNDLYVGFGWIIIPSILLTIIATYFIIIYEVKPLKKLSKGADEITKGNLDYRIDMKTDDIFGHIAHSFNIMAESLQRNHISRKQFFADAAHELKTPITVIKGNLEGMIDGVIPVTEENLNSLLEETEYLNNIIKDIKELAIGDAGGINLNKKKININKIIEMSISMLNMQIKTKNINLNTEFQKEFIECSIDPERFNQVIYNLLMNAVKYTPEKGNIKIKTEELLENNVKSVKITLKDNGKGIPPEDLPYIFERFYRVDKSRNRKTGGLGLGLSIVSKIIELHGGTIRAESAPGEGSSFYIVIPHA